jgi:hypothetical protein
VLGARRRLLTGAPPLQNAEGLSSGDPRAVEAHRIVGVHDADDVREVVRPAHPVVEPGQVLRLLQHRHIPLQGGT